MKTPGPEFRSYANISCVTELQYDFEESVGYQLHATARCVERAFRGELAPHGVTYRQAQVLCQLAQHGRLAQGELAQQLDLEPSTVVGILDRMERDGWIRREPCADDRRKKLVSARSSADPVWRKIVECGHSVRARATAGLSDGEVAELRRLLAAVRSNFDVAEPAAAEKEDSR